MIPVVVRRRKPTATMSWLLVIFFEPIIGLILYGLFGNNRLPRRRIKQHEPTMSGAIMLQSLPSGPTYPTENYQRFLVSALYAARRHVIITSPYMIPDEPFLQALQVAVQRGVKVELIVPFRSDQIVVGAAARAY